MDIDEAIAYYRDQGAPGDQNALLSLLREIMDEEGSIGRDRITEICGAYDIKESYILALVKTMPGLRLSDTHLLEVCCGRGCGGGRLCDDIKERYGDVPGLEIRMKGCMRMCSSGPNIRWDGRLFTGATKALVKELIEKDCRP